MKNRLNIELLTGFWLVYMISASFVLSDNTKNHPLGKNPYLSPRCDSCFFYHLNLDFPGMEEVRSAVEKGDYGKAKAEYMEFRKYKSKPNWYISPNDKPKKAVMVTDPEGDQIINHIIGPNMGAPEVHLGQNINWEFNPVDPSQPHYSKEWTWQNLNRGRMWSKLGEAYWNTLDEKYALEWVAMQEDWVNDNPVPLDADPGATFTWRTIESGIRISRWMNAYYSFLHSPSFTSEAHATFVKGIIEHGQRLHKVTTEQPERSSNWVTMECNGLGTLAILFPEITFSDNFFETAIQKMDKELTNQVYPDGVQIELTTGYHQTSRENFMELARFARFNNISLPERYMEKLKKMYWFNLNMMDPTGNLPPFNDARVTPVLSSLKEAYETWKDDEFLYGATLGKEGKKPGYNSYYFNWSGYYVMRSGWSREDNCLYFDAGPVGSGHEHEDMLNLYLYSNGKVLLTEAGTYSYDLSEWRKYVLSTAAHNTIVVDGKGQHRGDIEGRRIKKPFDNSWLSSPVFDYGRGTYSSGYQDSKHVPVQYRPREYFGRRDSSVIHTRHVIFLKPWYYVAVDFLSGEVKHRYDAHFHLNAPNARISELSKAVHTLNDSVQLGLYPLDTENLEVKVVKGQEKPLLGWIPMQKKAIPTVVFSKTEEAPATFSTLLFPYVKNIPEVKHHELMKGNNNLWGHIIETPYESASLFIKKKPDNQELKIETGLMPAFSTNASVMVFRGLKESKDKFIGLYEVSVYSDESLKLNVQKPSSLLILKRGTDQILLFNPGSSSVNLDIFQPAKGSFSISPGKWYNITASGVIESWEKILFSGT